MGNFFAGVVCASVIWGLGLWAYTEGHLERFAALTGKELPELEAESDTAESDNADERGRSKRRRKRGGSSKNKKKQRTGDPNRRMRVGDSLGPRGQVDMGKAGGEQQLTGAQIDAAFDRIMPAVRRCFYLVEDDMPQSGVLRFGLRIESNGKVSRSNLTGPAAMVQDEPGRCLRKAAESTPFPGFLGPPMQITYPVTLE